VGAHRPHALRPRLAYDRELCGAVGRTFSDTLLGFYRNALRARGVDGQSGVITVVQRTSADLRLNPHYHDLALDVFAETDAGEFVFHDLEELETADVQDLLQVLRVRIVRHLIRAGVVEEDAGEELLLLGDDLAEREPALAALARASVSGLAPAGPERRARVEAPPALTLRGLPGVQISAPLPGSA
jgi:hypothetical protein